MYINPKIIDHTNLELDASKNDIEKLCNEAKTYGFGAVCVRPEFVATAKNLLKDTPIKVCTVIGFPTGLDPTEKKVEEAQKAIENGADELDMVINIEALRQNDFDYVKNDIFSVKQVAKNKILKVIIETGMLNNRQKRNACKLIQDAGADFVKTSTGFAKDKNGKKLGATIDDVKLIKNIVKERLGIKASGGINTPEFAQKLIAAGATRIGTSSSVAVISDNLEKDIEIKYSWEWFKYHADQRLRAFYYYLIIVGALALGYLTAIQIRVNSAHIDKIIPWLFVLCCIVSISFFCLEIRNVELVNIGRIKLQYLGLEVSINDANPRYTEALEMTLPRKFILRWPFKHELWLRFIYILIGLFSAYLFIDFKEYINCSFWESWVPVIILGFSFGLSLWLGWRKN